VSASAANEEVPLRIRVFVAVFLSAFLLCGLTGVEAWPLSGFRLFSHLRTEDHVGWTATSEDRVGQETPIPFHFLPEAYRGFGFVARELPGMSAVDRLATCRAWAEAVRERFGREVVAIHVYRSDVSLLPREGTRSSGTTERRLVTTCELPTA
jgi:hypothetical protein